MRLGDFSLLQNGILLHNCNFVSSCWLPYLDLEGSILQEKTWRRHHGEISGLGQRGELHTNFLMWELSMWNISIFTFRVNYIKKITILLICFKGFRHFCHSVLVISGVVDALTFNRNKTTPQTFLFLSRIHNRRLWLYWHLSCERNIFAFEIKAT